MSAYYNEFDPQKAAWLRELIREGAIAPGDVDERSIADVRPDDLACYTQGHFFAGIGIWSYALRLAGWPDDREVWTGSCPCQPFSAAGKGEAFDDERHLWPEFFRLIEARRPVVCFGEQVSSIDGLAWFDVVHPDLEHADYTVGVLDSCAAGLGAPHRRQRLYWVAESEYAERRPEFQEHGDTHGRHGSGRRGNARRVAHGTRYGRGEERPDSGRRATGNGPQRRAAGLDASGVADGLGHASGAGLEERRCQPGDDGQERATAERTGDAGGMEDTVRAERRPDLRPCNGHREAPGRDESADRAGERSEAERLDHAAGARRNGALEGSEGNPRDDARLRMSGERGPVNGFWRDADWVLTRPQRVGDRPGLRPVERGAQQMVDGPAEDLGRVRHTGFPLAEKAEARVMRLRGYGDGIVAEQAAVFVRSYMELER